ncbi:MAG: C40 family peptidase [Lachnospiraceae bacterium]|nr:C40 family peptidase [Lachnospiraceae bacterium]MDE7183751.1 C40 family peptidase [Lachnospiraceae bacterium]
MKKGYRRLLTIGLCAAVFFMGPCQVQATEKDILKQQNQNDQERLEDIDDQVNELEGEQEGIDAEIETLSNEIAEIMASISLLEEEIEAKKAQIEQAKIDLEEAKKVERQQYEAMKVRVKAMYESGETSFLDIIFSASSMQDMLNKADYVEKMHEYDKKVFVNYQIARKNVEDLKETLEIEESELEAVQEGLEEERASVEEARSELEAISADYAVQISKAKQQAEIYKSQIKQRNAQIKKIEEEERRKAEEERKRKEEEERRRREEEERKKQEEEAKKNKNNNSTSTNTTQNNNNSDTDRDSTPTNENAAKVAAGKDTVASSNGSAKGKDVANYACGFVGNPYVAGGTSLTKGADCSGFTQSVYKAFGYSLPRNSTSQRSVGREVSYAEAEPGDIICYPGHVAIYIGNGKIVHASSAKTGIKISNALYRDILCVRRVV